MTDIWVKWNISSVKHNVMYSWKESKVKTCRQGLWCELTPTSFFPLYTKGKPFLPTIWQQGVVHSLTLICLPRSGSGSWGGMAPIWTCGSEGEAAQTYPDARVGQGQSAQPYSHRPTMTQVGLDLASITPLLPNFPICEVPHRLDAMALQSGFGPWAKGWAPPLP